jgi:hypothetical protein
MYAAGVTPTPELREPVRAHAQALQSALGKWRAGYDYNNFLETPAHAYAAPPPSSHKRLREIKAIYDLTSFSI